MTENDWNFISSNVSEFALAKMVLILWVFLFKKAQFPGSAFPRNFPINSMSQ